MTTKAALTRGWQAIVTTAADVLISPFQGSQFEIIFSAAAPVNTDIGHVFSKDYVVPKAAKAYIRGSNGSFALVSAVDGSQGFTAKAKTTITTQPASQSKVAGTDATFAVVAAGDYTPFTYQWFWDDVLIDGTINPSALTATLVNHAVTTASQGKYQCVITDSAGIQTKSANAVLTVTAAP